MTTDIVFTIDGALSADVDTIAGRKVATVDGRIDLLTTVREFGTPAEQFATAVALWKGAVNLAECARALYGTANDGANGIQCEVDRLGYFAGLIMPIGEVTATYKGEAYTVDGTDGRGWVNLVRREDARFVECRIIEVSDWTFTG